nr:hypothetical protein [Sphingomonas adhaesiva]
MATPVDQHQRPLGTEIAQIEQVQTGPADAGAAARIVRRGLRSLQRGKAAEEIGEVRCARLLNRRGAQRDDRTGGIKIGTADTRTGNDDFFASLYGGRLRLRRRLRRNRKIIGVLAWRSVLRLACPRAGQAKDDRAICHTAPKTALRTHRLPLL